MQFIQRLTLPLLLSFALACRAAPPGPLSQDAYLWQRDWNGSVYQAITQHADAFNSLVVLKCEVSWQGLKPKVVRVPVDFAFLKRARVGLALRIGPFNGPFVADDSTSIFLTELAASIVNEAKAAGLTPAELQLDFDCADSKLDGYRVWVEAIRRKIAPIPLAITALPSWLNQPSFAGLAAASGTYVLQVHSLTPPKNFAAPFTLCDPAVAMRSVENADKFGIPFRVALPTYGYVVAFDPTGKFIGLSAEGTDRTWPTGTQLREVMTDARDMAQLVQFWKTNPPATLRGIIWYRFPIADDALNLRWATLSAMMAGRPPQERIEAVARRVESGLTEISLENNGELDISSRLVVNIRWQGARVVAGDGIGGFEFVDFGPDHDQPDQFSAQFKIDHLTFRLPAGEKRTIGWLRLNEEREVKCEIQKP